VDNILVINLTRMGDIVQTGPLLSGLRTQHPGAHIALLVIDSFRGIAEQLPDVDEVRIYGQDESVSRLMAPGWSLAAKTAWHRRFVDGLKDRAWDLVINLTHSHDSALLSQLVSRGEIRGLSVHRNGRRDIKHDWVKYFFNVTANRGFNSFNLVDIYRRIGNVAPDPSARLCLEPGAEARAWAASEPLGGTGPLVMLQLGASKDNRRWPVESFARTARLLAARHGARFVTCGTQREAHLAAELRTLAPELDITDYSGRTTLRQLSALCARVDLLVSNDTGTMHIAASMGTPVVSLFLATALPEETAAWLPGTLVLQPRIACSPCSHHVECPHVRCREFITPAAVAWGVARQLGLGSDAEADCPDSATVRAFHCDRDADGYQDLVPLTPEPLELELLFVLCYRRMWKTHLRAGVHGATPPALALENELESLLARHQPPADPDLLTRRLEEALAVLARVVRLAREGMELTSRVARGATGDERWLALLKTTAERVTALDEELFHLELAQAWLRPLAVLFRFDKDELEEQPDLLQTNRAMGEIYRTLAVRAADLEALLRRTREAAFTTSAAHKSPVLEACHG
jgi:ADP-heptose:LPS heptosyltransferase